MTHDVQALAFDVFGTVVDWHTGIEAELRETGEARGVRADWHEIANAWRARYGPALAEVSSGGRGFTDLDRIHSEMLEAVIAGHGLEALTAADRARLVTGWHRLPPWPDSAAGLERLRGSHITATLSNGHMALLTRLVKHAGLRFDCILSAELAQTYKPHPDVYRTAAALLGVAPERVLMVAAHASDLEAAAAVGLRTAYVTRPAEWGPGSEPAAAPDDVDLVARDLHDLADQL